MNNSCGCYVKIPAATSRVEELKVWGKPATRKRISKITVFHFKNARMTVFRGMWCLSQPPSVVTLSPGPGRPADPLAALGAEEALSSCDNL